ncbi:MAG: bifunctional proline dehydrogenase/L-glutamate gamma-semialdehyde dehydrogenase PutA [Parvularculaceae bacterium]
MSKSGSLEALRAAIRAHTLADEASLAKRLIAEADIGAEARNRARAVASEFVKTARANAVRSGLIDKFLQEYGLSTGEGVTLMRLAEALLRTPDAATADALIKDKVEAGDWAAHKGKSPFPVVNFSTRALMMTAAWLDEIEPKDPTGKLVKATKDLLDSVGEPVIRTAVAQAMKLMGEHFVLGETIGEALRRGRAYATRGYSFSFDMLGEAALTEADAQKYFNDYENAIAAIGDGALRERPVDNPGISVKLSALHPRYEYAKKERVHNELGDRLRELALAARSANIGFNIDAEESYRLDISLDLIERVMRDPAFDRWEGFGVVVQAYQRRALFVIDWLAALARETGRRVMVRLVKGAYWDTEIKRAQVLGLESYPVFTRKVLTDVSFAACARKILRNTDVFYPQFATHNALTAASVLEMAGDFRDFELQRLHGMGEALHDSLIERGARSRIYAPVGGHRELLPYLVRRLLENGANSSFVNRLIDPHLSIDEVVADPVIEAQALNTLANTAIPIPRDLFNGARLSATGFDASEPDTADRLVAAVARRPEAFLKVGPILGGDVAPSKRLPRYNPAHHDEQIGEASLAPEELVDNACHDAARAQGAWGSMPATDRATILRRAADMLEARAEEFMHLLTREGGKTLPDAISEVREAVDYLRYYANEGEKLAASHRTRTFSSPVYGGGVADGDGGGMPQAPSGSLRSPPPPRAGEEKQEPLGVVVCISPWNFPLAIFLGQVTGALAAGNAVIAKPAEPTPLIAVKAVKLLIDAGVPRGVVNCMPGSGSKIGTPLVKHPAVRGVVFTGSTSVAQIINRSLVDAGKFDAALIAETGGVNAMIVDSTALLEQAVNDAISAAFQSAGQRCSACRLVCVQEDIAPRFKEMLAGAMAELVVGDPARLETDVGPVIDEKSRAEIQAYIDEMEKSARLVGRAPEIAVDVDGTFIRPVAFEVDRVGDVKREIFGPVLHIVTFAGKDLPKIVDDINALGYGLTLGVHTRIDETMHDIAARAKVGNIYINRNQIGAVVGVQPFGGEGLSGTGPKAGGPHYLKALVRRPAPDSAATIEITRTPVNAKMERTVAAAAAAHPAWSARADRGDVLRRATASARADARVVLDEAASIFKEHFAESEILPGPTGESNTLRLKGRGAVLCLGDSSAIGRQMALALAAGDSILAFNDLALALAGALAEAGAPGIAHKLQGDGAQASAELLSNERIKAVAFDGGAEARSAIAAVLAARPGAIVSLLSSRDQPWRYAVERTLTINTTAAGGDVRLLSLPD